MKLFIQKPILWNTNNYHTPSGFMAKSGYPEIHGYGHEEWNNSPLMTITDDGNSYRVFHTEEINKASDSQGQTFIFMTASHDGIQELVGIAANATNLTNESSRGVREEIAERLRLKNRWIDAWNTNLVRNKYRNDQDKFMAEWDNNVHWIPNWICPEQFYWWLDNPVRLNPLEITGKKRLLSMFGRYSEWDLPTAERVLKSIPPKQRGKKWQLIINSMRNATQQPLEFNASSDNKSLTTDVLREVYTRRGQSQFRDRLMSIWGGACAIRRIDCPEMLRASHIKPWSQCTPEEKLDPSNGILLSADLDALFDKGLITFNTSGQMLISSKLSQHNHYKLGLPRPLPHITNETKKYLEYHNKNIFIP